MQTFSKKFKCFIFIKTLRIVKISRVICYFSENIGNITCTQTIFSLFSPTQNLLPKKSRFTRLFFFEIIHILKVHSTRHLPGIDKKKENLNQDLIYHNIDYKILIQQLVQQDIHTCPHSLFLLNYNMSMNI